VDAAYIDQIGQLAKAYYDDQLDAAIARLDPRLGPADGSILNVSMGPVGTTKAEAGMKVFKSGCTTGVTRGSVENPSVTTTDPTPAFGTAPHTFHNLIAIRAQSWQIGNHFTRSGDSGSLVIDDHTHKAIGMVIGHYQNKKQLQPIETMALACHIDTILTDFAVSLVGPGDHWP
jgi:hypothetical protein